jgi:hypothetical protein
MSYRQPQAPPQQPPPPDGALDPPPTELTMDTMDSSLTVSSWPTGQLAGSLAALIGRLTSKIGWPPSRVQSRQRYS